MSDLMNCSKPELRGLSACSMYYMRTFFEERSHAFVTREATGGSSLASDELTDVSNSAIAIADFSLCRIRQSQLLNCMDMDKAFVDCVAQDSKNLTDIATYKTSKGMSEELLRALPQLKIWNPRWKAAVGNMELKLERRVI